MVLSKLATKSTGVSVTGTLAATAVTGDGSGLTSLTGASAGTFGASNNTPIITVDANGRITGIPLSLLLVQVVVEESPILLRTPHHNSVET